MNDKPFLFSRQMFDGGVLLFCNSSNVSSNNTFKLDHPLKHNFLFFMNFSVSVEKTGFKFFKEPCLLFTSQNILCLYFLFSQFSRLLTTSIKFSEKVVIYLYYIIAFLVIMKYSFAQSFSILWIN